MMLRKLIIIRGCQVFSFEGYILYNFAVKELPESTDYPLFQQYLMLLIKLQLNVGDQDLAYRFGINQATQCLKVFSKVGRYSGKQNVLSDPLA